MTIVRRTFLQGAGLLALAGVASCSSRTEQPEPRGYKGELRELPIPPADHGRVENGVRVFDLEAGPVGAHILPDTTTPAWGFNGGHLGPTLMMRTGEDVKVNVRNGLDEMTTIHWHGMELPAVADGGPHQPIEPGDSWSANWQVINRAATMWYHPHPHEATELHAYRGLAGLIVIGDDVADSLDLPHEYGVDDIPVAIMDQKFHDDGTLNEDRDPDLGLLGDTPTVNGITHASFHSTTRRLRLRLLNAATMRFFRLAFDDGRKFHIVATDSGLLAEPVAAESALLSPGERTEIIVDLEENDEITLRAIPFDDNLGVPEEDWALDFGLKDSFDLLRIVGPESAAEPAALPAVLDPGAAHEPDFQGALERTFALDTCLINGKSMDMSRVDVTIDHSGPEIWTVTNEDSDWIHNFHIHDASFTVLDYDPGKSNTEIFTGGWKDTILLPPLARAKLGVTFGHFPDPQWPYMYHCHMLLHEDYGMMGQFVIVEPGQEALPMDNHDHASTHHKKANQDRAGGDRRDDHDRTGGDHHDEHDRDRGDQRNDRAGRDHHDDHDHG